MKLSEILRTKADWCQGKAMRVNPDGSEAYCLARAIGETGKSGLFKKVRAALAARGFFSADELLRYGQDHSDLMNHISHKVPGVEFSTGSLGHGLPFGVGKALAADGMFRTGQRVGENVSQRLRRQTRHHNREI